MIAAGNVIGYRRGRRNSSRPLPIEALHDKINKLDRGCGRPWLSLESTCVQSWDAATGKVVYAAISSVSAAGRRRCIRIVTNSLTEIVVTEEQPVLLSSGTFVAAATLRRGDQLLVRGSMKPERSRVARTRSKRVVIEGLKYYGSGWMKYVTDHASEKIYDYQRQHRARLVVEASMNGLAYERFVWALRHDPDAAAAFRYLPRNVDVHHRDGNSENDDLENLQALAAEDHKRMHRQTTEEHFNIEYTQTAELLAISEAGVIPTFAVRMVAPFTNFLANTGIIVQESELDALALTQLPTPRRRRRAAQ